MHELSKATKLEKWGRGPWVDEPDHVEWRHNGVPCIAHRHPTSGHWCGYAAVEPGHPWDARANPVETDYGDGAVFSDPGYRGAQNEARVHWGITYGDVCNAAPGVCHVPEPGEPDDVYWLGFDCAHCDDYSPSNHATMLKAFRRPPHQTYRDLEYVKAETNSLADQIVARRNGPLTEET